LLEIAAGQWTCDKGKWAESYSGCAAVSIRVRRFSKRCDRRAEMLGADYQLVYRNH